jgi:hypothetical protein
VPPGTMAQTGMGKKKLSFLIVVIFIPIQQHGITYLIGKQRYTHLLQYFKHQHDCKANIILKLSCIETLIINPSHNKFTWKVQCIKLSIKTFYFS